VCLCQHVLCKHVFFVNVFVFVLCRLPVFMLCRHNMRAVTLVMHHAQPILVEVAARKCA
jgi:hypothetical protein